MFEEPHVHEQEQLQEGVLQKAVFRRLKIS